jgi:hypothetical protein
MRQTDLLLTAARYLYEDMEVSYRGHHMAVEEPPRTIQEARRHICRLYRETTGRDLVAGRPVRRVPPCAD